VYMQAATGVDIKCRLDLREHHRVLLHARAQERGRKAVEHLETRLCRVPRPVCLIGVGRILVGA